MLIRSLMLSAAIAMMATSTAVAEPLTISAETGPKAPMRPSQPRPRKGQKPRPICRVFIAGIKDLRQDPSTMGSLGNTLYAEDVPGWVRAGFITLIGDARFDVVDTAEAAELELNVDLLKSYVAPSASTSKLATVVFRVHYSHGGKSLGESIYRGGKASMNWASTSGEAIGSLNISLVEAVEAAKPDILKGCSAVWAAN
ncbi:MAG: hypothetical protein KF842_07310 [Caulobacter sp.]|nr:hypothetical protein [Caulobacter sp.]